MNKPVFNIAASVRARLSNLARTRGEDFQRILQRYAVERLLARLAASSYRDQFVLKGAMLYVVWGGGAARPTRDLDLLGFGPSSVEHVRRCFVEVCGIAGGEDGIVFESSTLFAQRIREEGAYGGVRVRVEARLEQARVRVQVDVAYGEAVEPEPQEVEFPPLLGGHGPRLRAYPHEAVLAEKFHAAVVLGETNSRLKDYYDLCVLPQLFVLEDAAVAGALVATFARRQTAVPLSVGAALPPGYFAHPDRAIRWRALLDRDGLGLAPRDLTDAGEMIRRHFEGPLALALELASGESADRVGGVRGEEQGAP